MTGLGALVLGGVVAVLGYAALRRRHARVWLGLTALAGVLLFRAVGGL